MKTLRTLSLIVLVGALAGAFPTTNAGTASGTSALGSVQIFASSGSYTSYNASFLHVRMCGAGGGSGGAKSAASGGGASGAYVEMWIDLRGNSCWDASTGGCIGTVTIGTAGTAGASTPTAGGNGGDTSIVIQSVTYTAKGGLGSPLASSNVSLGGAGQSGSSTGDVNIQGNPGTWGAVIAGTYVSGVGGSSPWGSGGNAVRLTSGATAGTAATGRCAGAGGGADFVGSGIAGAAGTSGMVIIEEWR